MKKNKRSYRREYRRQRQEAKRKLWESVMPSYQDWLEVTKKIKQIKL